MPQRVEEEEEEEEEDEEEDGGGGGGGGGAAEKCMRTGPPQKRDVCRTAAFFCSFCRSVPITSFLEATWDGIKETYRDGCVMAQHGGWVSATRNGKSREGAAREKP